MTTYIMASEKENHLDDCNSIARKKDVFTGTYEVQECLEGQSEKDLLTYMGNCNKNPGHKSFIPVNMFSVEHLPSGYHERDLYELIKALADVTVRIAVKLTSPDRRKFIPGTKDSYPCYNTRGQNSLHTGTGCVWMVKKSTEANYRPCPCPECDHSDTPIKVWWRVEVLTAKHVVFDSSEARQSSCRLWFDDDNSPVVNVYGWNVVGSYNERDMCWLYCVTHDEDVADKLEKMVGRFNDLCDKIWNNYNNRKNLEKLSIIVSHPHGCSKQVSVGHWVEKKLMGFGDTRYTYTTCTCPGSSGALVYRLGCDRSYNPHSGANSGGLNYSGVSFDCDLEMSARV